MTSSAVFFDTHAHLDDEAFENRVAEVVDRAGAAGVRQIVAVGTTAQSSAKCVELAQRFAPVYAAVGIQPNYAAEAQSGDWEQIRKLATEPKVVALGETGLDRYWGHTPFELQQDYFQRHINFSQETGLPFIVHLRDCEADILAMLREAARQGPLAGVMHSYTGTAAGAAECVELGLYISFAGMLTFKKSDELRAVAATVPLDRLLIETDSPYLSPHPHRARRPNEPALVVHTAQTLADVHRLSLAEMAMAATANARRLFRLNKSSDAA